MTRRRKALIAVVAVLVLLIAAVVALGTWYRPMLLTGTGYAAHNACAIHFLTGRDDPETDLPPNPLVPLLRTEIDDSEGWARSSVLGVAFAQQAWVSEYGCAVGDSRAAGSEYSSLVRPAEDRPEGVRLPQATGVPAEVGAALDRAAGVEGTRGLVAVHRGELLDEWYADGFGPDTRQLGWSMAKSVAATLVGRAQQEFPDADLDPAVTDLRPEWTDERAQISLDDLLRMTSGLEWDEDYDLGTPITQMLFAEPDMAAFAAAQPLAHEPGTFRQYSSGTTNVVCDLLHERTGLGPDMADQLLFGPLGMTSAVLEADASGRSVCSSYLWATPRDWARFGQFTLDDGEVDGRRLLPAGWMEYARTVVPAGGEPEPYGAQWWLNDARDGSPLRLPGMPADAYWASGHDGQYIVVVPSADLVVVRTGFTPSGTIYELGIEDLVGDLTRAVS
ncbi:serine hydrolase [Dietzia sp. SLG310A2-38A2]|uniref:serine hydrolase domain-containing protein n=1 Tax=Dietzia sp. SLG310A2-38A2 TaxID=1630643 RepID=UPI0015FC5B06|nr:serine hydrolase [Dietzia sp. SLG310A2-38A2]MBB1030424.1 serine hydrolase [Dietzia sp. SLG310A2-38A2]